MIDRELLEKPRDFDELVDTYVIFITGKDRFGKGLPLYHIERRIAERVKYFKEEEGGHGHMNRLWEELIEEERAKAAKEAVAKAEHDNAVDFTKTLLEMNKLSYGEIAKASKLTLEEVKAISSGKTA